MKCGKKKEAQLGQNGQKATAFIDGCETFQGTAQGKRNNIERFGTAASHGAWADGKVRASSGRSSPPMRKREKSREKMINAGLQQKR